VKNKHFFGIVFFWTPDYLFKMIFQSYRIPS